MAKIKLVVSATIAETFSDFIISKKTTGGFMEPAASDEEMFQKLFGKDTTTEANQLGAFTQYDTSGSL